MKATTGTALQLRKKRAEFGTEWSGAQRPGWFMKFDISGKKQKNRKNFWGEFEGISQTASTE